VHVTGQLVAAWTLFDPVPGDSAMAELRIVQPVIMARGVLGAWALRATVNLEGWTLKDGELAQGTWGEGFMDRRHPHTYAHELMLEWTRPLGAARVGVALGKGFVPFGTDDPMSRPPLRYPVNHHLSQILERALILAGARAGQFVAEVATFNGDEPEYPSQWPNMERFGDSWSARVTWLPLDGVESQVSVANVASPEHREGAGSEQWKWDASVRWDRPLGGTPVYGLVEWARTSELDGVFVYSSWLLEGSARLGNHRPYVRFEWTERPEEQRLLDPFRSQRPHLDNSILGITRWSVYTAGYTLAGPRWRRLQLMPLLELSYARVTEITTGVFDPESFYGRSWIWSATIGMRLDAGLTGHRMGRYGVLSDAPTPLPVHTH